MSSTSNKKKVTFKCKKMFVVFMNAQDHESRRKGKKKLKTEIFFHLKHVEFL